MDERLTAKVNLDSFGLGEEPAETPTTTGKYVPPKMAGVMYEAERDKAAKVNSASVLHFVNLSRPNGGNSRVRGAVHWRICCARCGACAVDRLLLT